jgi:hypothetical protein
MSFCDVAGSARVTSWSQFGRVVAEIREWKEEQDLEVGCVGRWAHWVRQQQAGARGGSAFEQALQMAR